MGYCARIDRVDLRCDRTISRDLEREDRWYLVYVQREDEWVGVVEDHFTWNRLALVADLSCLQAFGVRGTVAVVGEENEWTKYEVTDGGEAKVEPHILNNLICDPNDFAFIPETWKGSIPFTLTLTNAFYAQAPDLTTLAIRRPRSFWLCSILPCALCASSE